MTQKRHIFMINEWTCNELLPPNRLERHIVACCLTHLKITQTKDNCYNKV